MHKNYLVRQQDFSNLFLSVQNKKFSELFSYQKKLLYNNFFFLKLTKFLVKKGLKIKILKLIHLFLYRLKLFFILNRFVS